jgi:hypothetical protein
MAVQFFAGAAVFSTSPGAGRPAAPPTPSCPIFAQNYFYPKTVVFSNSLIYNGLAISFILIKVLTMLLHRIIIILIR